MKRYRFILIILLPLSLILLLNGTVSAQGLQCCDIEAGNIGNTSATIIWVTDQPANTTVNYGATPSLGLTASKSVQTTHHSIALTNLTPDTLYYYEVFSQNATAAVTDNNCGKYYTFSTFQQAIELQGWVWNSHYGYLVNATFIGYATMVERANAGNTSSLHVGGNLTLDFTNTPDQVVLLDMYGSRVKSLYYMKQEELGKSASFTGAWIESDNSKYYISASGYVALPNPTPGVFRTAIICFAMLRTPDVDVPLISPGGSFSNNVDSIITRITSLVDEFFNLMAGGFANVISKILFQLTLIVADLRDALVPYIT